MVEKNPKENDFPAIRFKKFDFNYEGSQICSFSNLVVILFSVLNKFLKLLGKNNMLFAYILAK